MNRYITYTARAKLRNIIESTPNAKAIMLTAKHGGFNITCLDYNLSKIIICDNPKIFTDHDTLKLLKNGSVDFSYSLNEFLITKDIHVNHSYA